MLRPLVLIWRDPALRLAAIALILTGCNAASIAPYQSLLAIRLFGLSDSAYALVLTIASAASVIGAIGIGILADQTMARKKITIAATALGIVGQIIVLLFPSKASFIIAHAVILPVSSATFGQVFALARMASSSYLPEERDGIMAAIRALFALPFIVILPLWSVVFDAGAGLIWIYVELALVNVVLVALILHRWPADGSTMWVDQRSGLSLGKSLREIGHPSVLGRVLLSGAVGSGIAIYMVTLGLTFDEAPGRDIGDVAIFAGLLAGLEVPVMLSMGWLLRYLTRMQAILLGATVHAGFLLAFPVLLPTPAVWFLVVPAAIGAGILLSLPIAYVQDLMGTRAGAGGAMLAVQRVASESIAAALFAVATWVAGYSLAPVLGGITVVLAALALWWLDGRQTARKPGPA
ncbi:MFS transporter [Pelagovum pacificum]|uniref:MFS transporter n=1 Tax=Pelagovum pacificum TaxID=2588711 RepID=A0A5C5GAH9_9RHOB|nr:MFS transporter [Pelagovum pacificum]QQA42479.1 MFS transporter [Pelagovum pacificum]TNY31563.1 MFS transporter [Pelagovum pacificum]